mgnify:CR=1 FL=1
MIELTVAMTETPRPGGGFVFDFKLQRVESDDVTEREKLVMRGLSGHVERLIRDCGEAEKKTAFNWEWVIVGLGIAAALCALM